MAVSLDKIVPWGCSRQEYELMFNLTASDTNGVILGCGDGPASFNAEMTAVHRFHRYWGLLLGRRSHIFSLSETVGRFRPRRRLVFSGNDSENSEMRRSSPVAEQGVLTPPIQIHDTLLLCCLK
jgi:hypothetical protein